MDPQQRCPRSWLNLRIESLHKRAGEPVPSGPLMGTGWGRLERPMLEPQTVAAPLNTPAFFSYADLLRFRGQNMEAPRDGVLLRVFIGEADRKFGRALYRSIVEAARKAGLAGATALHGPLSYGQSRHINSEFNIDAPGNLPMVVEIIDAEDKIQAFLPELDSLIGSGLVTLEKVRIARVGWLTKDTPREWMSGA